MRKLLALTALCAWVASAQMGRTFDWYTAAGDSQRSGWEKSDTKFTKDSVKDFKLIVKRKLETNHKGSHTLFAPVILGNLISYKGFKELAFVSSSGGDVWAVDTDLDRMFWERHFDLPSTKAKAGCPGGFTSQPTMAPGVNFGALFGAQRRQSKEGAAPAGPAPAPSQAAMRRVFGPRLVFLLASDGKLYRLDTSTGKDMKSPVPLVPAGADAANLNIQDNVVYTATRGGCDGSSDTVWAADISADEAKVTSFVSKSGAILGNEGVTIGNDGTVYVQTSDSLLALTPKELTLKQSFSMPAGPKSMSEKKGVGVMLNETSPLVFAYKGKDVVATVGKDGRIYLLDSQSLGGGDQKTPLYRTPPLAAGNGVGNGVLGLSSWETGDGSRWLLAAVWGPLHADLKAPQDNGDRADGAIVAFKVVDDNGKPTLTPAWTSRDLLSPETPVIANGVVFALSTGEAKHKMKAAGHATLYALDAETGKELYSSGDQVTVPASLTGLTIANGRVYFTGTDSTLYAFGYDLETTGSSAP